jgi:HlyD family secretion protein
LGLLVVGGGVATWYFLSLPSGTEPLRVTGRIEGYETDIGAKVAGRINYVAVREGDQVRKGQVIVRLDDEQIQAQFKGATARLVSTQQQELQARLQINLLDTQIQEQQLNLQQAQGDAKGRIFQAESSVAASEAQLSQAEAQLQQAKSELNLAQTNRDRFAKLLTDGAITQQQFDQAQTTFETALATVRSRQASVISFRKLVGSAQGQLVQAQTTALNPNIRNTQLAGLRTQLAQTSPIDGVVTTRTIEPGAVVTHGKTLLTVINPNTVYLRGYVPEGDIGKVRVGQQARVFLDSAPDKPMSAKISAIDTQASFTPENIYFQKDRVKQVFGVRISIDNPGGFAKPGMPADAEIVIEPEARK